MEAWKKYDIEKVWDMMSPRLKHGNDDSLSKYKEFAMKQGVRPFGYKIRKITINDKIAVVEAEMQTSDFYGRNLGSDWEKCKFINIDEVWYLDDCKLIDP